MADQFGVDERTIRRDGQFAEAVEELKPFVPDIQERVLRGDVPSKATVIEAALLDDLEPPAVLGFM